MQDINSRLPSRYAITHQIVPISVDGNSIVVACLEQPTDNLLAELQIILNSDVSFEIVSPARFQGLMHKCYGIGANALESRSSIPDGTTPSPTNTPTSNAMHAVRELVGYNDDEAAIIAVVNELLLRAKTENATDIHIEPMESHLRVRFRIDGLLLDIPVSYNLRHHHAEVVSRIKVMANLDIAERRLPQDGRIKALVSGVECEYRVSILPTQFGESVDIRILLNTSITGGLDGLGMWPHEQEIIKPILNEPHGVILVTGPTGSGKTTTLYSFLHLMNEPHRKIITIEDPIEYHLDGVTQVQVHPRIGLTFARGLRSFLRHDPDIMMVGEIRDQETAETAIRVALTGHLVFSTLHTNDAASTPARLLDMGIEPYLLASSLRCIIAQRLVRTICKHCSTEDLDTYTPDILGLTPEQFARIDGANTQFRAGAGCSECHGTGYRGRTAIFEVLPTTEDVHDDILARVPNTVLQEKIVAKGCGPLRWRGMQLAARGITSVQEVMRVTAGSR